MIFVVFSCDEPKGIENTESTQTGTTSDNNTNTDTDNTTTDNNTDTDNEDYITQNPYEELEKTLTIKINSIDEVEITEGEWEFYYYYYENEGDEAQITEEKGVLTVQDSVVLTSYNYEKTIFEYYDADTYAEDKEYYSDREGLTFDDENKIISFPQDIPEDESCTKEEFLDDMSWYFQESTKEETEEYLESYTFSVSTNSPKDAYIFFTEVKYVDKIDNEVDKDEDESANFQYKYIFKKIK